MKKAKEIAAKEKIIEAASKVFAVSGFERARMEDVAVEAGISKGTIYLYFKSKYDLYVALKKRNLEIALKRFRAISLERTPWATLETGLKQLFSGMNENRRRVARLDVNFWASAVRMKKIRDMLDGQYSQLLEFLQKVIQEGIKTNEIRADIDPTILGIILLALVDGLELHWTILNRVFNWDKIVSTIIQVLHYGAHTRGAG